MLTTTDKFEPLAKRLQYMEAQGLVRQYHEIVANPGQVSIDVDGDQALMFCTNDYLGLSKHPDVIATMKATTELYGCGSGGSRFIGGTNPLHHQVESALSRFHGKQSAILFSNGYMANLGAISSLAQSGDLIFSDQLNHASIIDGCRLSRAKTHIWQHNRPNHLHELLCNNQTDGVRFIVCESLYSMDGDFSPLSDILAVAKEHDCYLFVDEIHALGIYGEQGKGVAAEIGIADEIDILMAGNGKSLGLLGGYVAASDCLVKYMRSKANSFIFTTALPPAIMAATLRSLDLLSNAEGWRQRIRSNAGLLRRLLDEHDFNYLSSKSHIFPIITGNPVTTKLFSQKLLQKGVYAQGVIYPSVPLESGRLRVTVTPQHTEENLHFLVECLRMVRDEMGQR